MQQIAEALQHVNMAIANINKCLATLEQTNTMQLFSRDGIIQAIQSGDMTALDVNTVDQALQAMQGISQSTLMLNNALAVIKNDSQAMQMMKIIKTPRQAHGNKSRADEEHRFHGTRKF